LQNLVARLENTAWPPVDILHFDGHGVFDPNGRLADKAKQTVLPTGLDGPLRETAATGNQGYLLFEDADGSDTPSCGVLPSRGVWRHCWRTHRRTMNFDAND
jgi:hypothetical protein